MGISRGAGTVGDGTAINQTGSADWTVANTDDVDELNASDTGSLNVGNVGNVATGVLDLGGDGTGEITGDVDLGGAQTINKAGGGTWTLSGTSNGAMNNVDDGTLVFGSTGIGGDIDIASGATAIQGVDNAIDGKTIQIDGTLDLGAFASTSLPTLTGSGSVTNGGELVVDGTGGTFSGSIQGGSTSLVVALAGSTDTQVLSGSSTYGGETTISNGILSVQDDQALGADTAGTTIQDSGQLALSGDIETTEPLTLESRASGDEPQVTSSATAGDTNTLSGTITLSEGTDDSFTFESTSGALTIDGDIGHDGSNDNIHLRYSSNGGTITGSGAVNLAGVGGDVTLEAVGDSTTVGGAVDLSSAAGTASIVNGSGSLGFTDTVDGVDMSGGQNAMVTNTSGGVLSFDGDLSMADVEGAFASFTNNGTSSVEGALDMSSANGKTSTVVNEAGTTSLNDVVMTGADTASGIFNTGGSTTISGTLIDIPLVQADDGTVFLTNDTADNAGVTRFETGDTGIIDADGVVGNFALGSGQIINGSGTVLGEVTIGSGATVEVGDTGVFDAADELTFGDNSSSSLTFTNDSLLKIEINPIGAGISDVVTVLGALTLKDFVDIVFDTNSLTLNDEAYVFMTYDSLSRVTSGFSTSGVPGNYHIDYAYSGNNIALVRNATPVPAPLALIGLGALVMGGFRRKHLTS